MSLALFDLDNTLIAGDSDHLWGEFLIEQGLVDDKAYKRTNDQFYQDYVDGSLDIRAYLRFALEPLTRFTFPQLSALHERFFASRIAPIMLPKAAELIDRHRRLGDELVIITATNKFITAPIANKLGIAHLLASEGEIVNQRYTGEPVGIPCFKEGKVERLFQWIQEQQQSIEGSHFYSDSANDIPLLEAVSYPVAVDPDERLRSVAQERDWPVISLR
ncbi:HAD-superfamily subfamily IB hydrolase, TIGR01490 [Alteromonadaceae bacterium Bs31]|nr:HAD-superfamily subfamily IB hydrolase, TIGR01490 [Alteromonadaceae bacterium Bs31]